MSFNDKELFLVFLYFLICAVVKAFILVFMQFVRKVFNEF